MTTWRVTVANVFIEIVEAETEDEAAVTAKAEILMPAAVSQTVLHIEMVQAPHVEP